MPEEWGERGKERAMILTEEVFAVEGWREFSSEALSRREIIVKLGLDEEEEEEEEEVVVVQGSGPGGRNLTSCREEKVRLEDGSMGNVELRPPRDQRMVPSMAERR